MKRINLVLVAIALMFTFNTYGQVGFFNTNNSGNYATALGYESIATGSHSTALGFRTQATGGQSFAAGHWSYAQGLYSFALGARAIASETHAMAFGLDVSATKRLAMVIGSGHNSKLVNDIENSLMVGFKSDIPTLFVGPSNGIGTVGQVGIGTTTPDGNLHVFGADNPRISLSNNNAHAQFALSDCNGCYNTFAKPNDAVMRVLGGGDLIFAIPGTNESRKIAFHTEGDKILTIQEVGSTGKVGVGTTNFPTSIGGANISHYKLFVKGGILADEVRVRTGWADYVFDKDYQLKSLSEVENHINQNGYLPNMPSEKQVLAEGIGIGDITKAQQEKIEEVFLHLIEMDKRLKALEKENQALKAQLKNQK